MLSEWSSQPAPPAACHTSSFSTTMSPAGSGPQHLSLPSGRILVTGTASKQTFSALAPHFHSRAASHATSYKAPYPDVPRSSSTSVASPLLPQRQTGSTTHNLQSTAGGVNSYVTPPVIVPPHVHTSSYSSNSSNPSSPMAHHSSYGAHHKHWSMPLQTMAASSLPRPRSTQQMQLHKLDEEEACSSVMLESSPDSRDLSVTHMSESE
jgi:hypothetical protein